MKVPSYDDLTPSIPDASAADLFAGVHRIIAGTAAPSPAFATATAGKHLGTLAPSPPGTLAPWHPGPPSPRLRRASTLYAAVYGGDLSRLASIARDFSPRIQRGADDVVLDVSGLGGLLGEPPAIAAELARAGALHAAIAPSQIGARLLARARPGIAVAGSHGCDLDRALAPLPLDLLRPLTARDDEHAFDVLRRWGLRTLGEFAALPACDLSARLGRRGVALQRLARGIDAQPLVPDADVPRFVRSLELEWPLETLEPLSFVFARLLEPLAAALERADRGAAAIRLELRLTDRTTHTRVLPLPAAMRDARVLRTLLLLDLESHLPPAAVDVVTIEADPAPARIVQFSLLARALPSAETLATLHARLGALVGADRCGTPILLDSHRTDAIGMGSLGSLGSMGSFGSTGASGSPCPNLGNPRNPTNPWNPSNPWNPTNPTLPVIRLYRPPVAVRVSVDGGRPVRVAVDRQGMPGGRIVQAAGPWRTSGGWWGQADGTPWDRDEWDVACSDGAACRLSRDRVSGVWFLEGVFD